MNVRYRTYNCTVAHDADPAAVPELEILGTFCASRNKCSGSGLISSGSILQRRNLRIWSIFLLDLTFCRRFYGVNSVVCVRIRPPHCP
jgi:hypothetical protein